MFKLIKFLIKLILLIVLALILILIFNPWGLRAKIVSTALDYYFNSSNNTSDIIETKSGVSSSTTGGDVIEENIDKNPLLSAEQEKTLESWGVDVTILPKEISPEMQACLVEKIGEERIAIIIAGDKPSALELIKAKGCL